MKSYQRGLTLVLMLIIVCGLACQPQAERKTEAAPAATESTGSWTVEVKTDSPAAPLEAAPQPPPSVEQPADKASTEAQTPAVAETPAGEAEAAAVTKPGEGQPVEATVKPAAESADSAPAEKIKEGIAVTVNGVDITANQIEERIKPQLEKASAQLPPSFVDQYKKQLRQQVIEGMIVEQLLDEKVKENNIMVTEEEVVEHLQKAAAQQNLTLDDIKAMMEARGQSFDTVKQRVRKGLGYQKYMESRWAGQINVTEDDARKYYSENTAQFETPEQVRASHILIQADAGDPNVDPNDAKAKAKAKAQQLLEQVRGGADFATLAKDNSSCPSAAKGGDLDFFGKGQMVPDFEKVAFELKIGQVSDIVETQFGYHIIKVTDRKDARLDTFEQVKDNILNMLAQKKQNEFAQHYVESLKAGAKIVYPAGEVPLAETPGVNEPAP